MCEGDQPAGHDVHEKLASRLASQVRKGSPAGQAALLAHSPALDELIPALTTLAPGR